MEHGEILIIDDDAKVLNIVADTLQTAGYSPQVTDDPRQATALLMNRQFSLIISDIVMPYLTGLEVLELARRRNPAVEVLLITGYSTQEMVSEAVAKGACAVIEKPFDADELIAAVGEALRRARLKELERSE